MLGQVLAKRETGIEPPAEPNSGSLTVSPYWARSRHRPHAIAHEHGEQDHENRCHDVDHPRSPSSPGNRCAPVSHEPSFNRTNYELHLPAEMSAWYAQVELQRTL